MRIIRKVHGRFKRIFSPGRVRHVVRTLVKPIHVVLKSPGVFDVYGVLMVGRLYVHEFYNEKLSGNVLLRF